MCVSKSLNFVYCFGPTLSHIIYTAFYISPDTGNREVWNSEERTRRMLPVNRRSGKHAEQQNNPGTEPFGPSGRRLLPRVILKERRRGIPMQLPT